MDERECGPLIVEHARTDDPEVVQSVIARTHGWAAAVVLASRTIAAAPEPVAAARRFAEGQTSVADGFATEVFSSLQPRERHLLLSVATEEIVTLGEATHLSHDERSGEVLAGLEATGLLVTRVPPLPAAGGATSEPDLRFRIHPLLTEVVRRRLVAGGVDVVHAQATIRRAVQLDVARGATEHAFSRLVRAHLPEDAARLLAAEGATILMRGQGAAIAPFARAHPETVEDVRDSWFVFALDRWLDNDPTGAGHWLDRIIAEAPEAETHETLCPKMACVRLFRALVGGEPLASAVGHARRIVLAQMRASGPEPMLPLLVSLLGVAQTWLGELTEAEVNLTTATSLARARGLDRLAAGALSHLALTVYMQGREQAASDIADEALEALGAVTWRPDQLRSRALLARSLARMSDVTRPEGVAEAAEATPPEPHAGDPVAQFWSRVRAARLALMAGSVPAAQQALELPLAWLPLPEHLRVTLVIERGFLASLSGDQQALRQQAAELESLGARGEAALLTGLLHELESDRKAAVAAYRLAEGDVTHAQPASRALALTCEAQLLDVLGRGDEAIARLREAATITEVRRNSVPFLGWSRQGTPIETLLRRLDADGTNAWVHELATAVAGKPDIASVFAPVTATPRERGRVADPSVIPALSAREREVLNELARGATYADIAADLFVSENTVKTHVSSLYSKLAVTRRSEALAVARNLHLL
jgi:ATP/maltotriose-dependent transcriptional regulator MalT